MFSISNVEVNMSKNLTELFGRNFISSNLILTKSIPIFEELFNIESGTFTKNSESLFHSFSYLIFSFGHGIFSLAEFQVYFSFFEVWLSFKSFCSMNFINFIADFHPVNVICLIWRSIIINKKLKFFVR